MTEGDCVILGTYKLHCYALSLSRHCDSSLPEGAFFPLSPAPKYRGGGVFFVFPFTKRKKGAIMDLPNKFHNAIIGIFFSFYGKGELYLFSAYTISNKEFGKNANSFNADLYGEISV